MSMLFAFDPGLRKAGCALFLDGILCDAWLAKVPASQSNARGAVQWARMAERVFERLDASEVTDFIYEAMQIYKTTTLKQSHDLLQLTGVAGAVAYRLRHAKTTGAYPRTWKPPGQSKTISHARMRTKLDEHEARVLSLGLRGAGKAGGLDVCDAVAIGLYYLRR